MRRSFFSIGLKVKTKSFAYEMYCRPTVTYGLDLLDLDEKVLKSLRTDEGILLKRISVVPKRSQTTPIYKLLKINEPILQIIIMKIKLYERLKRNELTNSIIKALETMPMEQISKNIIVKEIKEAMNIFDTKEINKKSIKESEAKLDKHKLEMYQEDKARIDQIKYQHNPIIAQN
jgi:transcriptional regulator NrdR family protein